MKIIIILLALHLALSHSHAQRHAHICTHLPGDSDRCSELKIEEFDVLKHVCVGGSNAGSSKKAGARLFRSSTRVSISGSDKTLTVLCFRHSCRYRPLCVCVQAMSEIGQGQALCRSPSQSPMRFLSTLTVLFLHSGRYRA